MEQIAIACSSSPFLLELGSPRTAEGRPGCRPLPLGLWVLWSFGARRFRASCSGVSSMSRVQANAVAGEIFKVAAIRL
jgi:hypothetical protein